MVKGHELSEDLFWYARIGDDTRIFPIIEEYPEIIYSCDEQGCSILHMICGNNKLELLKSLRDKHDLCQLINRPNSSGNTPIHWAVLNRYSQMVEYLIELGADYNALNSNGESPIELALVNDDLEIKRLLENLMIRTRTSEV